MSVPDIEILTTQVAKVFKVEDLTAGNPKEWVVRYRGHFLTEDTATAYDQLAEAVISHNLTPLFRNEPGSQQLIYLVNLPAVPELGTRPIINIVLFVLTILSVMLSGVDIPADALPANGPTSLGLTLQYLFTGWPFALSLVSILFAHEMGHYIACRYYKVPATLPFFLPAPLISPLGTLGAFIMMRGIPKNKRVLFDIGVAGPLAGLVLALPILFIGLAMSTLGPITPPPPGSAGLLEGNSIFYLFAKYLMFGKLLPEPASFNGLSPVLYWIQYFLTGQPIPINGLDVQLHPVAFAGWAGLLVTALNLVPVGTLDGGHVAYGLFGDRAKQIFPVVIGSLIALSFLPAILTLSPGKFNFSWLLWMAILFWLGRVRAQPLDDITELDPPRRALGWFALILFFLLFTPIPLATY